MLIGLLLSLFMGLVLGLLGGGGAILALPIFMHAFGLSTRDAIPMSLLVVGLTAAAGLLPRLHAREICWRSATLLVGASTVGAWAGGRVSGYIDANVLMLLFAAAMVAAGLSMWRGQNFAETTPHANKRSTAFLIVGGLLTGLMTGMVGAGGGFLLVPLLMRLRGMSMRMASGTSLFVISMNAMAGLMGHLETQSIDLHLAFLASAVAMLGAALGGMLSRRLATQPLRRGFAMLVFTATVWIACPILCVTR